MSELYHDALSDFSILDNFGISSEMIKGQLPSDSGIDISLNGIDADSNSSDGGGIANGSGNGLSFLASDPDIIDLSQFDLGSSEDDGLIDLQRLPDLNDQESWLMSSTTSAAPAVDTDLLDWLRKDVNSLQPEQRRALASRIETVLKKTGPRVIRGEPALDFDSDLDSARSDRSSLNKENKQPPHLLISMKSQNKVNLNETFVASPQPASVKSGGAGGNVSRTRVSRSQTFRIAKENGTNEDLSIDIANGDVGGPDYSNDSLEPVIAGHTAAQLSSSPKPVTVNPELHKDIQDIRLLASMQEEALRQYLKDLQIGTIRRARKSSEQSKAPPLAGEPAPIQKPRYSDGGGRDPMMKAPPPTAEPVTPGGSQIGQSPFRSLSPAAHSPSVQSSGMGRAVSPGGAILSNGGAIRASVPNSLRNKLQSQTVGKTPTPQLQRGKNVGSPGLARSTASVTPSNQRKVGGQGLALKTRPANAPMNQTFKVTQPRPSTSGEDRGLPHPNVPDLSPPNEQVVKSLPNLSQSRSTEFGMRVTKGGGALGTPKNAPKMVDIPDIMTQSRSEQGSTSDLLSVAAAPVTQARSFSAIGRNSLRRSGIPVPSSRGGTGFSGIPRPTSVTRNRFNGNNRVPSSSGTASTGSPQQQGNESWDVGCY